MGDAGEHKEPINLRTDLHSDPHTDLHTDSRADLRSDLHTAPHTDLRSGFIWHSANAFFYYITIAVKGYLTVFLQLIGFSATNIGIISAFNSGVGIVSQPFWGAMSDKLRSVKKVLILCIAVSSVAYAIIPFVSEMQLGRINAIFFFAPIVFFFQTPTMNLFDNFMVRSAAVNKLDYGAIRAFGALSYAAMGLILGFILPSTGIEVTFYASVLFIIPPLIMIGLSYGADSENGKKNLTFKEMRFGQIAKSYYLMAFIIFTVALRIPNVCAHTFLPYLVAAVGENTAQIGFITGFRAFVEVPAMLLLKPLSKKVPMQYLLVCSGLLYGVADILNSMAVNMTMLIAISVIHGVANGLMLTASVRLVFILAPEHLKATAQTLMGAAGAIAGIIGSLIGGGLVDTIGVQKFYFIMGTISIASAILYAASNIYGDKILRIMRPKTDE